jgi:hypothetical protein
MAERGAFRKRNRLLPGLLAAGLLACFAADLSAQPPATTPPPQVIPPAPALPAPDGPPAGGSQPVKPPPPRPTRNVFVSGVKPERALPMSFPIDPKTPLKDLLPTPPKSGKPSGPVLTEDLSAVPEVQFEAPTARPRAMPCNGRPIRSPRSTTSTGGSAMASSKPCVRNGRT